MRDRLKHLTKGVAIYGAGDAAIQVVNVLLLAVYVKGGFLTSTDYGALALIIAIETFAKVLSRLGLDGAFMRYFHERGDELPRLASTIAWFLLTVNVVVFGAALALAAPLGVRLFDDAQYITALRLMFVNTFLITLTFIPFHAMRMKHQAVTYSGFTFARTIGTLLLRIALVIGMGWGIAGMYAADLVMTVILLPLMWPWFRPYLRAAFSTGDLRTALRFGLPRVPHGLAQQALDSGNKLLLNTYVPQAQLGVYQNAVTLGTGVKFFTSAFETAWAPFYYATAQHADATRTFGRMTTYALAVLVLIVAGTAAIAPDVVLVMLTPDYTDAAAILPIVAVGMAFQGVYLLTSIGLNLTSRTEFYPVATVTAAIVGLAAGVALMPRLGVLGASVALLLAYVTQAGVAFHFARRLYPIPYEAGRIARIVGAGIAATLCARWIVPEMPPLAGLFARGATTVAVFGGLLWMSGFLRTTELAFLREKLALARRRPSKPAAGRPGD